MINDQVGQFRNSMNENFKVIIINF